MRDGKLIETYEHAGDFKEPRGSSTKRYCNGMPQSHNAGWQLLGIDPLSLLMSLGGAFLFWRGRQYAAKANAERILTDSDPHVLYLRAFRSDNLN
jgi:hypothetical protein